MAFLTEYEQTGRVEGANVVTIERTPDGFTRASVELADGTGAWTSGLTVEQSLSWSHAVVAEANISERVADWARWS